VVVQPHLDDAVLSCFALMSAASALTVITVFAGIPHSGLLASTYDLRTGSTDPRARTAARRTEDETALAMLGARCVHLDFLDSPYRAFEVSTVDIATAVLEHLPPTATAIAVPLGLGAHVDHLAVSGAAVHMWRQVPQLRRYVFADYPYAAFRGWPGWVSGQKSSWVAACRSWSRELARADREATKRAFVAELDSAAQERKLQLFHVYESQVAAIEGGASRYVSHPSRVRFEVYFSNAEA